MAREFESHVLRHYVPDEGRPLGGDSYFLSRYLQRGPSSFVESLDAVPKAES